MSDIKEEQFKRILNLVDDELSPPSSGSPVMKLETFDELMKRDTQREADGFPRKIKIKKLIKGNQKSDKKVIVIPFAQEEKLVHVDFDPEVPPETGGQGEGEEGDTVAEQEVEQGEGEGEESNEAGSGSGGDHGISQESYEMGKQLSEKLDLPNLKDKGKKVPVPEWTYDMVNKTRRRGQHLNKTETVKSILRTNLMLKRITPDNIDTTNLIVSPNDRVYNSLSREKKYQSQAVVFLARDYSGSMGGKPTEITCSLHTMIYTWLVYQYNERVIPRFVVHDTEAKEVHDFNEYYKLKTGGGTYISPAFGLINQIIDEENLERNYNIYCFYSSDGDLWGSDAVETDTQTKKLAEKCNRMGITVIPSRFHQNKSTEFETVLQESKILENPDLVRATRVNSSDEKELEEVLKYLASNK